MSEVYSDRELVYEGHRTRVLRARDADGNRVILKQLVAPWPTTAEVGRLKREYDLLASLDGQGAPKVLAFEHAETTQLVTEDLGAVSLASWLTMARTSAPLALEVALGIGEALAAVHAKGVLHRDINPSNLIVDPETAQVWLIDFDLASPVPHRRASPQRMSTLEGTPAYFAPEQTGRMNRAVDARSDLYALGMTLYELFAGHPPFKCPDLLAYAHAHLAVEPPRLQPVLEGLPASMADLVHTLIRKRPEERYQSAAGVVVDLRRVVAGSAADSVVPLLGKAVGDRPEIPQELYGRQSELLSLVGGFRAVAEGDRRVVLVSGEAGIGKTSLVHELYRPVTIGHGRLLEGKFDQYTRDLPYKALGQVLGAFASDILAGSIEEVETWRLRLARAAGSNASLLVDLAPQLELLLGPQEASEDVTPADAERRLHETLRRTLRSIARRDAPVVVFLDDLQWADLPSLRVLEALFKDPELGHLMVVGAWRSEEVDSDHALRPTLEAVRKTGVDVHSIELGPLAVADVGKLLSVALQLPVPQIAELTQALHDRTGGNPFFLRRLVEQAGDRGAIHFDLDAMQWRWDVDAIEALGVADNVVAMLRDQLQGLSGDARTCLSAAALIGETFALDLVVAATGLAPVDVRAAVAQAVAGRFVHPLDDDWWKDADTSRAFRFGFVHDRVQQAARMLLDDDGRDRIHLALARSLADHPDRDQSPFQVAEHYCAVQHLVTSAEEKAAVLRIALRAGARAMYSAAYDPAHRFLEAAVAAGGSDLWERDPNTARHLRGLAAHAAWLVNRPDLLEAHVDDLRTHSRNIVDRLRAEEVVLQAAINRGELHQALDLALDVLREAGTELPRKPTDDDVMAAVGSAMVAVAGHDVDTLTTQTVNHDPAELGARRLLVRISSAAYVAEPNLLPLIATTLVERTIERGASRESSYGFAVFSLVLSAAWMLEQGSDQGRIALGLLAKYPDRVLDGLVRHVVHHYARVWNDPLREIYEDSPDLVRSLMDVGDLEYAGWVLHFRVVYGFYSGVNLDDLAEEVDRAIATMRLHDMAAALHCTLQFDQLIRNLRGEAEDPARLIGPDYDEDKALEAHQSLDFRAAVLALSVCKLTARVFFRDEVDGAHAAADAFAYQDGAVGLFYQIPMRVYGALAILDTSADVPTALEQVEPWREPIAAAALRNPGNYEHLLALYDAEVARAEGDLSEAILQYDRAIAAASSGGFVYDQALANERVARLHLRRGADKAAQAYLLEARYTWQRWGAKAKVDQLDALHGEMLAAARRRPRAELDSTIGNATTLEPEQASRTLDFESVLKASQAIAQEVDLDSLMTRSMQVLIESVGARRGVLLLAHRGQLQVEAVGTVGREVELLGGEPFDGTDRVPRSIVRRVWRGGGAEVLDDASQPRGAAADPYLERDTPLSVICIRITHQGRSLGVLYFENDLSTGVFTHHRVRVLEALAPQLAISVRNARLQAAQDRFVPHQFLQSLERDDILDVEVGDHKLKEVSVFFSDIWGFTPLVEHLEAADALAFINRYLAHAEPAITGMGGFIDTYLGDGIMALFDHPQRNAQQSVTAAVAFHRALDRYNDTRRRAGEREVRTGVGINTGVVTMATIGGQRSLKCGVVGDAVNLASRVEGLTRRTGSRVLISEHTRAALVDADAFAVREVGRVRVRGRQQAVAVFEVLDAEPASVRSRRAECLSTWQAGLDAFYRGAASEALVAFERCVTACPDDLSAARFLERSAALVEGGVPDGWDGVEQLAVK